MDKRAFATIAAALQTYYPRFNLLPNSEAMELWYQELGDLPSEVLTAALRKWVTTEKWPPSIAELRGLCAEMTKGPAPDWGGAWGEVQNAVRFLGYMREKEALESMSSLTRSAVERIGWRNICCSENPEALRAQFRQIYEIVAKRENESRQLPPKLQEMIAMIGTGGVKQLEEGKA